MGSHQLATPAPFVCHMKRQLKTIHLSIWYKEPTWFLGRSALLRNRSIASQLHNHHSSRVSDPTSRISRLSVQFGSVRTKRMKLDAMIIRITRGSNVWLCHSTREFSFLCVCERESESETLELPGIFYGSRVVAKLCWDGAKCYVIESWDGLSLSLPLCVS